MNDTFDSIAFTQIESFLNSTPQTNKSDRKCNISEEISLDDSVFLEAFSKDFSQNVKTCKEEPEKLTHEEKLVEDTKDEIVSLQDTCKSEEIVENAEFNNDVDESINAKESIVEVQQFEYCEKIINNHNLSSWGLPDVILRNYAKRGITSMFDWQLECLSNVNVLKDHKNLVYSAPTSAGKTLVAEILALKCLFERKKKVIFILPFISVVREKMYYFQDILGSSGKRVEGFMGSYNPPGGFQPVQMAIGTIEKCNSLMNRLLEEGKLEDIGLVIIDELHLIGDPHRGYLLELLLTKIKYIMMKKKTLNIQIVGMSATFPNLNLLKEWLDAELYITNFRPIPLYEMIYSNKELYDNNFKTIKRLKNLPELAQDSDDILQLTLETISYSCSVLIFCPTKNWCENLAQQMGTAFWRIGSSDSNLSKILRENLNAEKIKETLEQLKYCPSGLDKVLRKTISFGVAFHHAGLTMEERDIIESGFRSGAIKLLIATSTLSSGVNLPARRVIIRSPLFNGKPIDILTYRQMIGRAGRMGIDTEGESILICQKSDYNIAKSLVQNSLNPISSCLQDVTKFKRALLEIISSEVATSPDDLELFKKCTLLDISSESDLVNEAMEFLEKFNFIRLHKTEDNISKYFPTALGKACLSSSLPPGEGLELFTELEKARRCFVLETELHLIYLVTPYSACYQWSNIDWMFYIDLWEKLPLSMKKVGELVGVRESLIINAARGKTLEYTKLMIHKRFFVALALQDLVNEKSLEEVSAKFNCNRGMLQSLQQSASTFAGMVTSFARQLGWSSVEILISQFQDRLQFGVNRDLLDLLRLPSLNSKQARAIYNSGIETLVQLANSDICTIEKILHKVVPFENIREREDEKEHEFKQRSKLRTIWVTGKQGLTEKEAAELILTNSREYLENEMGVRNIKWGAEDDDNLDESTIENSQDDIFTQPNKTKTFIKMRNENDNKENLTKHENSQNTPRKTVVLDIKAFEKLTILSPKKPMKSVQSRRNEEALRENEIKITPKKLNESKVEGNSSDEDIFNEFLSAKSRKRSISTRSSQKVKKLKMNDYEDPDLSRLNNTLKDDPETTIDLSKFTIINVCKSEILFKTFCKELEEQTEIAFSVACSKIEENHNKIGFSSNTPEIQNKYYFKTRQIDGFAFSWDGSNSFYFPLENESHQKLIFLKNIFKKKKMCVKIFNCKECIVFLNTCLNLEIDTVVEDPKIFDWLLDPHDQEKTVGSLVSNYCLEAKGLLSLVDECKNSYYLGMNVNNSHKSKTRAVIECLITWNLLKTMKEDIKKQREVLLNTFAIEMTSVLSIAKMEAAGIGIDITSTEVLTEKIKSNISIIERKIYNIVGRKFSLSSKKEIAKILGVKNVGKLSTTKKLLEQSENPLSDFILLWRKLTFTLSRILQPLLGVIENRRIYGKFITHTSNGRISMHEPNIQNVAKNFEFTNPLTENSIEISCRGIFVPRNGCLFLSVDYCQIELRILANLSKDKTLCKILNSEGDIFKSMAAKWNKITVDKVTEVLRNQTKQICYGIIYGMGCRTLAEQLKINLEEASDIVRKFNNAYPGIEKYMEDVLENCRTTGFVETLSGRRRKISHINDDNLAIRSHAERQAFNSIIQGSASDLMKIAMRSLQEKIVLHLYELEKPILVLHLHDELLFEVPEKNLKKTANIIKQCMESCINLSVRFPVKIKTGNSWGILSEFTSF